MKIACLKAELHIFAGEVRWNLPLRLQICFGDGATLRLGVSGNGEGLVLDRLPLEPPMDFGAGGRTDIFDVTDRLDPNLKNGIVGAPVTIRNPRGKLIGLSLPRPGGEAFCLWVHDDELHWGSETRLREDHWIEGWEPALADPWFD